MSESIHSDIPDHIEKANRLTEEEREAFEYLRDNAENFQDGEFIRRLAELVLRGDQSSKEVTNA